MENVNLVLITKKELVRRNQIGHHCRQWGWKTYCQMEPPCIWLEDIIGRGFPWGWE